MQTFLIIDPATGRGTGSSQTTVPNYEPHDHEIPCTSEQFGNPTGWMFQGGDLVQAPPLPTPVPAVVSRAQARIQLLRAGLLDQVEAAVKSAGGEIAIWYADAANWQRSNIYVAEIGRAQNQSDAQIDELFRLAAQIAV